MIEVWKDIKDYKGLYQVSNIGSVRSLKKRELSKGKIKVGYFIVSLWKNGVGQTFYVHRLVAEAFIPNPYNKREINHKNGIKIDNRIKNLEWNSTSENMQHAYRSGCIKQKLSSDQIISIRRMYKKGFNQLWLANEFFVSRRQINNIIRRVQWITV